MEWELQEALAYYQKQGAPGDQQALVSLLKEIQENSGGGIPMWTVTAAAEAYGVKESFLLAVVRRYPRLRLENTHLLEVCAGPNCSRRGTLAAFAEQIKNTAGLTVKYTGCMRMCGKGPNIRWDGRVLNGATGETIRGLLEQIKK